MQILLRPILHDLYIVNIKRNNKLIPISLFITVTLFSVKSLAAVTEDNSRSLELTNKNVSQRIDWIESRFNRGAFHAKAWQYGWTTVFSASVLTRSYIVGSDKDANKQFDAGVGIFTSMSGLLSVMLKPLPSSNASALLSAMPEDTQEQRYKKLNKAEQLLKSSAFEEKRRRGWKIQAVFLAEQLLAGLAIGVVDDRPKDGLKVATLGMLASELFTFTAPVQSISDWDAYANGTFSVTNKSSNLFLFPHPRGVQMALFF